MVLHALIDIRKMQAERHIRAKMKGTYLGNKEAFYESYFLHLSQMLKTSADSVQQWYENRYMPLMVNLIGKHHHAGDWVMPLIQQCRSRGIKLVVLSDYDHAEDKLQALGLSPKLFDWVVSAPALGGLKPAPQLLHQVAQQMGVAVEKCLVIGDREDTDGAMARATGAQFQLIKY
jgi:HAD superfamily hydrolase (TIGR01549 family)